MDRTLYRCKSSINYLLIASGKFLFLSKEFLIIILFSHLFLTQVEAQDMYIPEKDVSSFVYDEIPVNVVVEGYTTFTLDVIYTNNNLLYVNVEELFKTLQIACKAGQGENSLSGFIENESQPYLIDYATGQIQVGSRTFNPSNGLVMEFGTMYIESSLFAEAFDMKLTFNYRSLSIKLVSNFELPVIKQMRIEKMRSNLLKIKGVAIADTIVKRNYHLLKFGILDWSFTGIQTQKGSTDNYFGLGIGAELLYGEANVSVNYSDRYKFNTRQLSYHWRWVDNDKQIIKQAQVGKTYNQSIAFLNSQVIGASVRNTPTTIRKASGYYTINDVTEPNWTVELYINNTLVDYTQADASGLYMFKVPIVYGYTTLKLKFYGPLGEERMEERNLNVPYTFVPAGEFDYGLSGGVLQDSSHSRFGRGDFNYGINRRLTIGGGLEYLSSISSGNSIPFARVSLQPLSNLTLNAEYAYGVRSKGLLNYYFGKNALLELEYSKYVEGQRATVFNANEEWKVRLSVPIKIISFHGYAKVDYSQLVYKEFLYNQGAITFSGYYTQFSLNSTTQFNWIDKGVPYMNTDLAFSLRMKNGVSIRPSARYNVTERSLMTYKAEIEKRIPRGYFSVSYERYLSSNDHYINVSFKYDLPFARTSISASLSKGKYTTSESAQGSLAFGGDNYTNVSKNSSVSKGGILLYPFLDLNQNGVFDKGEHLVKLNTVKISGGRAIFSEKDSIVRIPDLNAFTNYILELNDNDLETISWRFKNNIYQVLIDPNQFKRVDIPVISVGEVSGMAYKSRNSELKGLGRVLIKFYKKNSSIAVAETLSESDGYFYYLGLKPGEYIARIDSVQLSNLGFTAGPPEFPFTIKTAEQGDMVGGFDFILRSGQDELGAASDTAREPGIVSSMHVDTLMVANQNSKESEIEQEVITLTDSMVYILPDTLFKVQLLALSKPLKDKNYFAKLKADVPGITIEEKLGEDGFYHYSTVAFKGITDAAKYQHAIRKSGWKDSFVAKYAGEERTEKTFRLRLLKYGRKVPAQKVPVVSKQIMAPEIEIVVPEKDIPILQNLESEIVTPDAVVIMESILVKTNPSKDMKVDSIFQVQLLAMRAPINIDSYFALLLSKMPGLKIIETQSEDGLYRYIAGTFKSYEDAGKFNKRIRNSGWVDSFITSYSVLGKRE